MRRTSHTRSLSACAFTFAVAALLTGFPATAQEVAATPNPADQAPGGQAAVPAPAVPAPDCARRISLSQVKVAAVWAAPPYDEPKKVGGAPRTMPVELRDTIGVRVEGLKDLVAQQKCLTDSDGKPRNIILYLDRRPLPNLVAAPPSDPEGGTLLFPLKRTEDSREVWTYLLGRPRFDLRPVEVSVGIDDQFAMQSHTTVGLRAIPLNWFIPWAVLFAGLLFGFVLLARRSDVLRDPVTAPDGARPPFSLARVQAAWWFFLVLAAYLLIGMVTGDFTTSITGTALALLGISAGTVAGSAFVDASKSSASNDRADAARARALRVELQDLEAETEALRPQLEGGDPVAAHEVAEKEALQAEKWSTYRKLTRQSEHFVTDILSDSSGVNFHRFQMVAWTIVLGVFFVADVYRNLAMPEFSATLLGLMGISAGTYLGLKIPENGADPPIVPRADEPNRGVASPAPANPQPADPPAANPAAANPPESSPTAGKSG